MRATKWRPGLILRAPSSRGSLLVLALLGAVLAVPGQDTGKKGKDKQPAEPPGKVQLLQNVGGHTGRIADLAFSADGQSLYTVGEPGEVAEWDVATGARKRVWRFPGFVARLALSANGQRLAELAT